MPRLNGETPPPPAQEGALPRPDQLIEVHKAWITAAAGMPPRRGVRTRRRIRIRHLRPAGLSAAVLAGFLLVAALFRGGEGASPPADLSGEMIPTLGAEKPGEGGGSESGERPARAFRAGDAEPPAGAAGAAGREEAEGADGRRTGTGAPALPER